MPWWYSEKAIEVYRYLSWLHTDMIPYWYTLALEAHVNGTPVCRPLVWSYQVDTNTWNISDEYTIGEALLVAPLISEQLKRDVYLPEGNWINFWDEREVIPGKQTIEWAVSGKNPLRQFPLYIKEGSIIPMKVENEYTGFGWGQKGDYITINIWPKTSGVSSFTIKDKDNDIKIDVKRNLKGNLNISASTTEMNFIFRIHIKNDCSGFDISVDSTLLPEIADRSKFRIEEGDAWNYDKEDHVLWMRCNGQTGSTLRLKIKML